MMYIDKKYENGIPCKHCGRAGEEKYKEHPLVSEINAIIKEWMPSILDTGYNMAIYGAAVEIGKFLRGKEALDVQKSTVEELEALDVQKSTVEESKESCVDYLQPVGEITVDLRKIWRGAGSDDKGIKQIKKLFVQKIEKCLEKAQRNSTGFVLDDVKMALGEEGLIDNG